MLILGSFIGQSITMPGSSVAKPVLSGLEQILYGRLVRAFPGKIVLPHAALVRRSVSGFVLCRPDFTAIAVIELETMPPALPMRKERRADALRAAGIKVIHLSAGDIPSEAALKALVAAWPLHASTEQLNRRAS